MPILIPSKNIYSKQYEKNVDNLIAFLQVKTKKYTDGIIDKIVYSENVSREFYISSNKYSDVDFQSKEIVNAQVYDIARAYAYIQPYLFAYTIKINKDKLLENIISIDDLKFDVVCEVETGTVTALSYPTNYADYIRDLSFTKQNSRIETVTEFSFSETASASVTNAWATAKAQIDDVVSKTRFTVTEHDDYFNVIVGFVCGTYRYNLIGEYPLSQRFDLQLNGTYEKKIPKQVNISFQGISKTIEFKEEIASFGDTTSKNAFIIGENNELMQNAAYYKYETGKESVTTYLAENFKTILDDYKNGKKKLHLLCDISNYYYYDDSKPDKKGSIAISRDYTRLTFQEYDEVIPMIKKADGTSVPLDKNEDGTPMVFVVLSVRVFYDGAVWQELTLQQK